MNIFNIESGVPVLNPELLTLTTFRAVLSRRKTMEGDHDGRKKFVANREMAFIAWKYHYPHYRESYHGKELDEKVREAVGLPDDWKEDELVKDCAKEVIAWRSTITSKTIDTLIGTLFFANDLIQTYQNKLMEVSKGLSKEINLDDKAGIEVENMRLDSLMKTLTSLMKISKDMPNNITALEEFKVKYAKEVESEQLNTKKKIDKSQLPRGDRK